MMTLVNNGVSVMNARIDFSEIPSGLLAAMREMERYVENIGIEVKLKELIYVQVSMLNQCAFCIDMHFKEATAAGEESQRLYSLPAWREAPYYSAQERACLAWAEYVTFPQSQLEEGLLFEALLEFFDKQQIADLTLAINQINGWNRLMKAFGIQAGGYVVGQFSNA